MPAKGKKLPTTLDPVFIKERFEKLWVPEPNTGCFLWIGNINDAGYGRFCVDRVQIRAHRFSYELYRGKIPENLQIDHLCRNRGCVNPDHLEPVTQQENIRRGEMAECSRQRKLKNTHCPHGHPYSGENLIIVKQNGQRVCRICRSRADRKRKDKMIAERTASKNRS